MATEKVCSKCGLPGVFRYIERAKNPYELGTCNKCIAAYASAWRKGRSKKQVSRHNRYMKKYRPEYRKFSPVHCTGTKEWIAKNPEKYLYKSMRSRSDTSLTFLEFVAEIGGKIPEKCPVLGIQISVGNRPFADNSASVDRIDNTRPYEKGNIAIISYRANAIKRNGTADEHIRIANWMEAQKKNAPPTVG